MEIFSVKLEAICKTLQGKIFLTRSTLRFESVLHFLNWAPKLTD